MKVILAETAGFCYGVERAVNLARETAKARGGAMLGSIVHNAGVVREIEDLGMRLITSPDQAKAGETVLIRAHGESRATLDALRERGAEVVSAVCPHVERIRKLAQEAEHEGRRVILIGERHHPEVQGIAGWCSDPLIFENVQEAQKYLQEHPDFAHLPSIMLAQTTCIRALWESCVKFLKKQCTNLKINDTICNATQKRQTEAAELSAKVDAMVVVGDRRSANTRHLTEICRENCGKVLQIESADELSPEFFSGCRVAGLTAGASTPASIIMEVLTTMTEENINTTAPETSESFEELLEKSFKTLNTGDKVTGIVTAIGTTEIQVDVGCKQAGYIPVSELSSDPDVKPEDVVKVGDEIETYVMLVNEHPRECVDCTVKLAQGERLCGTRLDLLNGTDPVAFDGTLELAPFESCFVALETDGELESGDGADMGSSDALALDINGPWTVALSPADSGTFGAPQELEHLCDLTAERFPDACGTFRYRTLFELANDLADAAIDLGDVYEVATLTLDGHPLGTRICPPYRCAIDPLAAGTHELTVDVINTLDHAIPDIFALTEPIAPSGILGPVTLCGQNLPK